MKVDPEYSEKICTSEIQPDRYENRCPFYSTSGEFKRNFYLERLDLFEQQLLLNVSSLQFTSLCF